ncbi:molybdenum cofactor guanylyltransferase [uncultured Flavonifractor sp.]|uniref:molybdenum cofactor guanylyltransferase n=1 Tax=uncultured Flavonifractor sp. TaxID=1193534 RepID=UPI00263829F4|nr:molybdenum cofactor guanylyltransferase [uncultured Flavonifractor sp.]
METAAVILTGGRSSRMGRDKAALTLGGEALLTRLIARFRGSFQRVWVSGPGGLPDLRPGLGPLAGLESALACTGAERIFLTAVDLPFADPALARLLVERLGEADACLIRRRDGRAEPLFAAYRATCLPRVRACLDQDRRAMGALLDQLDCRFVAEEALPGFDLERILLNVNTPADWCRAEKILNSSLQ